MLGRRAHRELVHVGLAQDDRAGLAQPLGDVRVVWRAVALEDARARGALAAGHGHEVLERDRDAQQRPQCVERVGRVGPGGRQAGVGGVGLGQGAFAVDREPRVEPAVVALRRREMGLGQLVRRDVACPQERGHLVGEESGRIGHRSSRIAGTTMKSPSRAGALASTASTGSDGRDDVLSKDVLELDRLRRRGDVVGRQLGQDRVLVEDVVELALEPRQLGIGEPQTGEMGDVFDVRSGQGGHAPMIPGMRPPAEGSSGSGADRIGPCPPRASAR